MNTLKEAASVGATSGTCDGIRIREALFEDYEGIASLASRNKLHIRSYREWTWLWEGNPAYKKCGGRWAIGWVLENQTAQVVGTISNIPFIWRFQKRDLRVAACAGWAVDPAYRRYSLGLLQRFLKQGGIDLFVSSTASRAAESALRVFNWAPPPAGEWNRSEFWITGHQGFLKAVLAKKRKVVPEPLCDAAAWLWGCADRLRSTRAPFPPGDIEVERRQGFDAAFDSLWERLERIEPEALLSVRSSETLTWHFHSKIGSDLFWILLISDKSGPIGYAIFDRQDNSLVSLKRVRLVDFQAVSRRPEALRSALAWMLRECRQTEVHTLEIFGCWLDFADCESVHAPYKRELTSCSYLYSAANRELREVLKKRAVWRPSSLDGDSSF